MELGDVENVREVFSKSPWPLLMAADGEIDQAALSDLAEVQLVERYSSWPPLWRTLETQTLLFRLLSRQGAGIKEIMVVKHRGFPYRLFQAPAASRCGA